MGTRLTERTNNAVVYIGRHTKLPGIDGASSLTVAARRDVMSKLADYEDTGLTPEEVATLKRIMGMDLTATIKNITRELPEMMRGIMENLTHEQTVKLLQESLRKN